jgi:hypothetical protein
MASRPEEEGHCLRFLRPSSYDPTHDIPSVCYIYPIILTNPSLAPSTAILIHACNLAREE